MKINLFKNKEKLRNLNAILNTNANKKIKEKSRGRSMVEMLGVLAIIGVLSIGGIQGYTLSMRRYRANEIIDMAHKYALLVYSSCQTQLSNGEVWDRDYLLVGYRDNGFWRCQSTPFESSGLGSLPSDVKIVAGVQVGAEHPYDVAIQSKASGDLVTVPLVFKSLELCQTVQSITNDTTLGCSDYTFWGHTGSAGYPYILGVTFIEE